MPFQPINFAGIEPQGNEFMRNLAQNLTNAYKSGFEMKEMPGQLKRNRESEELANAFQKMKNEQYPENQRIERGFKEAQTKEKLNELNKPHDPFDFLKNLPNMGKEIEYGDFLKKNDPEKYKQWQKMWEQRLGKGYGGTGTKDQLFFQSTLSNANPNFNEEQTNEAFDAVARGENKLSDGTPIKIPQSALDTLDRIKKSGTTAGAINRNIFGAQAESELPVVDKYINEGLSPYSENLGGYSGQEFLDSIHPKDKEAQIRRGKAAAANVLAFEKAQIQQMLASGKTSVTGTKELMELSKNNLKNIFPSMTPVMRETTINTLANAFKEMFEARKNVGIGAAGATRPKEYKVGDKVTAGAEEKPKKIYQWDPKLGKSVEVKEQ